MFNRLKTLKELFTSIRKKFFIKKCFSTTGDHSCSTYKTFSRKLAFPTPLISTWKTVTWDRDRAGKTSGYIYFGEKKLERKIWCSLELYRSYAELFGNESLKFFLRKEILRIWSNVAKGSLKNSFLVRNLCACY